MSNIVCAVDFLILEISNVIQCCFKKLSYSILFKETISPKIFLPYAFILMTICLVNFSCYIWVDLATYLFSFFLEGVEEPTKKRVTEEKNNSTVEQDHAQNSVKTERASAQQENSSACPGSSTKSESSGLVVSRC